MIEVQKAIRELKQKYAQIAVAIEALEHLNSFADANLAPVHKRRKRFSRATRAKMRAAQQARWKMVRARKLKLVKGKVA